jgi:hypothetical protein
MADKELRSACWLKPDDLRSFGHRLRMMQLAASKRNFRNVRTRSEGCVAKRRPL